MNRRTFLKSLFAAGALTAVNPEKAIEQFLVETEVMTDMEFITYVHFTMNLIVHNPAHCAIITDIQDG